MDRMSNVDLKTAIEGQPVVVAYKDGKKVECEYQPGSLKPDSANVGPLHVRFPRVSARHTVALSLGGGNRQVRAH